MNESSKRQFVSRETVDRLRDVQENLERIVRLTKGLGQREFEADEATY